MYKLDVKEFQQLEKKWLGTEINPIHCEEIKKIFENSFFNDDLF
jgi:hypothetical protein